MPKGQCRVLTPAHLRPHHVGSRPHCPPRGRAAGEGGAPDPRCPSQRHKASPSGDALSPPPQRTTPARKSARCEACAAGSSRPHHQCPGNTGSTAWLPALREGQPGVGKRLTPDAPHDAERSPPPGRPPASPAASSAPQGAGHARQRDSAGPERPHTRAHSMQAAGPDCPPRGWAAEGGKAPDTRRPSERREAPPPSGAALPPPPQRTTPARKSARCGAGFRSERPHHPRLGNTSNGAGSSACRERAAGRGKAPDTRRSSQQ